MSDRIRSAWARFWDLLDSDSVRPFIPAYYFPLFLWGIYGTFVAHPIALIVDQMGPLVYNVWLWLQIPATVVAMAGLALRHGGSSLAEMSNPLLFRDWLGLWMQFGGHACMHLVLLTFVITGVAGAYWGQPVFSVFAISSYVVGTAVLALQCARKLWRGFQLQAIV